MTGVRQCTCFGESGGDVRDCPVHRSPLDDAKALIKELDRDYPEPKKKVPTRWVGYWSEPLEVKEFVDEKWSPLLRWAVIGYLRSGEVHQSWRGSARCRFPGCRKTDNGSQDLTDGDWKWPSGYAHYLTAHGVKPPPEFIAHVMRKIGMPGYCTKTGKKCRYSDATCDSTHCLDCGEEMR